MPRLPLPRPSRRAALLLALVAGLALAELARPAAGRAAGLAETRAALDAQMDRVGARSGALVVELRDGRALYARRADARRTPASVQKLYTTAAALRRLGPQARLRTQALGAEEVDAAGRLRGDLVLRGAGDPSLAAGGLAGLARSLVADHGLRRVTGSVVGDGGVFDARLGPPSSRYRTSRYVGPLGGLGIDRGVTGRASPFFQASPARFAAQALQRALRREGVAFGASARAGRGDPAAAVALGAVASPTLRELVARTNRPSDNFYAETLLKLLGAGEGRAGTTARGAGAVRAELDELALAPRVVDGSGLSRANATSPREVVELLRAMREDPAGPALAASLPVAGRSGTLVGRMRGTPAAGDCRAKTGTLTGVSALAGYCLARDGRTLAFAFLMNGVGATTARAAQDAMAVALARADP